MQLQVLYFERVATSVFCQATCEVGDGVNELICDIKQELNDRVRDKSTTSRLNIHLQLQAQS